MMPKEETGREVELIKIYVPVVERFQATADSVRSA
jgi:hypothetical protein